MQETTKKDLRKLTAQMADILIPLLAEQTGQRKTRDAKCLLSSLATPQKRGYLAEQREEKSKKHPILFGIIFASLLLFPSVFIFALPVSAAGYHATQTMTNAVTHQAHAASNSANLAETAQSLGLPAYCFLGPLSLFAKKCRKAPECSLFGLTALALDPRCRQGTTGDGAPWSFPCSDKDDKGTIDAPTIQKDWFSGDPPYPVPNTPPQGNINPNQDEPGHFFVTYPSDTYKLDAMQTIFPLMQGAGFALLTPVIVLIGYQLLWASWTYGYAKILGLFPQLLLSVMALAASYTLISMLIDLENSINHAILMLHVNHVFPPITINGHAVPLTLQGDNSQSLRGIIMPLSRWGCQANLFVGILESKFITDALGAVVPFIGGLIKLAGTIVDAIDVIHMLGGFILAIMSIGLCGQVLFRIILLNYYILISPVVFACWALPGGVGQGVVNQWFKGFFSLLFVQTFQTFVAVTLPLILPPLPNVPWDGTHLMQMLILQLPPIIVLMAINKVPKIMGTKATAAMGQAGSVASGAVTALAATAWNIV